jgi:hypothetical protein
MTGSNQNVRLKAQNKIQSHYATILKESFIAYSHGDEIAED